MAENEDGQEKTEEPSGKRLADARKKGQVPRSRELNSVAMTLAGGLTLLMASHSLSQGLRKILEASLAPPRADLFDTMALLRHFGQAITDTVLMLAPYFGVMVVVAVAASMALGGINLSTEAIQPKLEKINPLTGLKRLFSPHGLVELGKSLAKFALVALAVYWLLRKHLHTLLGLSYLDPGPALGVLANVVGWSFVLMAASLLLVALVDVPFQLWDHRHQLKMTRQEVKDERKQTEGNPEIKGRIRSLQRELAFRRMMQEVPKADVIVTNPTHYAVALRYDQARMSAPRVVAKGVDLIARNIRKVGGEAGVPVVEAPVLARALYASTEIGDLIPGGLYLAVAQLLAYVFQLEAFRREGGDRPRQPDFPVPEDLRTDS